MNEVVQAGRPGDHQAMRWWAGQEPGAGSGTGHGTLSRLDDVVRRVRKGGGVPGQAELEAFGVDEADPLSPPVPFEDVLEDEPPPEVFVDDAASEDPDVDFSGVDFSDVDFSDVEFSEFDVSVVDEDFSSVRSLAADPWSFL